MEPMNLTINSLPAFTYRWLHMNEQKLEQVSVAHAASVSEEIPDDLARTSVTAAPLPDVVTGSGSDVDALIRASGVRTIRYDMPAGKSSGKDALRLKYHFTKEDRNGCAASAAFLLGEGSTLTVVMDFTSDSKTAASGVVQAKARLEKGAHLNLVQVVRTADDVSLINDFGADCADDASVSIYHLFLGGKAVWQGCRVNLAGDRSQMTSDTGYMVGGERTLDMNYDAYQTGRKTVSNLQASGVLSGRAKKLYRGTIDFQKGCAGSTGDEMEDVLMMDETVMNQTIPLILCAEEDVVGNHGATIGRLNGDILFYAETRGISQEEIYAMMSHARIDAIVRKIPDMKMRHQLYVDLGEEVE